MNRERRKNAGKNMKALLTRDIGDIDDDDFYKNIYGGFNDKSDDKDFSSADESSTDIVDSDFDNSESDIDETNIEIDKDKEKKHKRSANRNKRNVYGYPYTVKPRKGKSNPSTEKKNISLNEFTSNITNISSSSNSTAKTNRSNGMPKRTMTQKQLLEEAKKTELLNIESLKYLADIDLNHKSTKPKRITRTKSIRLLSPIVRLTSIIQFNHDHTQTKRGMTVNTVSFQDGIVESKLNKVFQQNIPKIRDHVCEISAKKAKYCDPLSGKYFHDVSCFRKIRNVRTRLE